MDTTSNNKIKIEKKPIIFTFTGQALHGKTSSVQILQKMIKECGKKALAISYSDYVQYMARQYCGWDGSKDESGRNFLNILSIDKIRTKKPSFWFDIVFRVVDVLSDDYDYALIDGCRFENEINQWKDEGYHIISVHVKRKNFDNGLTEKLKNHPSETALNHFKFDQHLYAENLTELEDEIRNKLKPLL